MLDLAGAKAAVLAHLRGEWEPLPEGDEWVVQDELTLVRPWGWVLFCTSRSWLETQDLSFAVAGNAPMMVERSTGKLIPIGTNQPVEVYIEAYERARAQTGSGLQFGQGCRRVYLACIRGRQTSQSDH